MVAALFAGAAVYVSVAEHPARLSLDDRAALTQWKLAYAYGAVMQASLAIVGFLLGILAWWQSGRWLWLIGAIVLLANWPYTLIGIMSTNRQLKDTDPATAGPQTRALLEKWGALHAMRSALGFASMLVFLWALMR